MAGPVTQCLYVSRPNPYPTQRRPNNERAKVAVCGPKSIKLPHWPWVTKMLDRATFCLTDPIMLTFGHSDKMIDKFVFNWAGYNWYTLFVYYLDSQLEMSKAIRSRDREMISDADFLVAFSDGSCAHTESMVRLANNFGVKVRRFNF